MRRIAAIIGLVGVAALVFFGQGAGGSGASYEVRGMFDNGGFLVPGEEVRIAGAKVGTVSSVDVTMPGEWVNADHSADPGKAAVVMKITEPGFQDFRQDATCLIRPQSLLGEKYVDCQPTLPRAPGAEAPPPLAVIPDGQPGAGERFLPIENNGKEVDLDLVNNIMRQPYADRFRLILNDLGAGLAARGKTLDAIIQRADPALRQTDRVLAELAAENHTLSRLAADSDTDLAGLARERQHITGFINNANTAGEATAERSQDLEAGLQKFPGALHELRLEMIKLRQFSDQATPVFAEFRSGAPAIARATEALGPFAHAATPSLTSLGSAAAKSQQPIVASDPIIRKVRDLAKKSAPGAKSLNTLLASLRKTGGYEELTKFLFNTTGGINGFDQYGHFLRAALTPTSCVALATVVQLSCNAHWGTAVLAKAKANALYPAKVQKILKQARRRSKQAGGGADQTGGTAPAAASTANDAQGEPAAGTTTTTPTQPGGPRPLARRGSRPARHDHRATGLASPRSRPVTRRGVGALAASPTLVGAITTLIVILAVFLAYNANNGLPFVPSYRISVQVPNAEVLVPGNDVRVGGVRVGFVESVEPVQDPQTGAVHAKVDLKLDKTVDPLPTDSSVIVRSKSALGLKYLEIDKGTSKQGYAEGSILPLAAAHPHPVEIDQVLNTFDPATRHAAQQNLVAFGDALAGRGPDLNAALGELQPLVEQLEPVARNLASQKTGLARFFRAAAATAAEVAPVAELQAQLFVNLDTTFGAFAAVARPFIQETISETPPTLDTVTRTSPRIRSFLGHSATLFADLRPGIKSLSQNSPAIASALETGADVLPGTPALNAQLPPTANTLQAFAEDPGVQGGIKRSTQLFGYLDPTLRFVTPAQSYCNYASLLLRNAESLLSVGDRIGKVQRFLVMSAGQINNAANAPNSENGPSSAPANGGGAGPNSNFLHSNPYPYTASPGQPHVCAAGNEKYIGGQVVIGNPPLRRTKTEPTNFTSP